MPLIQFKRTERRRENSLGRDSRGKKIYLSTTLQSTGSNLPNTVTL